MQTVSLLLCPPKPPIWSGKSQTTRWISCLAKVSKVARNILKDGNQLTIQHLAPLERPAHQKTNLTKLCKIYQKFLIHTRSIPCIGPTCEPLCAGERYSWCGIYCYNRAAINTFRSHSQLLNLKLLSNFYVARTNCSRGISKSLKLRSR